MINEQALKQTLIYLVQAAKKSTENEAKLFLEIGVLRATVKALDPTFQDNYELRKRGVAPIEQDRTEYVAQKFDEIIELLNRGLFVAREGCFLFFTRLHSIKNHFHVVVFDAPTLGYPRVVKIVASSTPRIAVKRLFEGPFRDASRISHFNRGNEVVESRILRSSRFYSPFRLRSSDPRTITHTKWLRNLLGL